jgi:hypothetical protein
VREAQQPVDPCTTSRREKRFFRLSVVSVFGAGRSVGVMRTAVFAETPPRAVTCASALRASVRSMPESSDAPM